GKPKPKARQYLLPLLASSKSYDKVGVVGWELDTSSLGSELKTMNSRIAEIEQVGHQMGNQDQPRLAATQHLHGEQEVTQLVEKTFLNVTGVLLDWSEFPIVKVKDVKGNSQAARRELQAGDILIVACGMRITMVAQMK
ncbi:unnamed protein product, partial [Amoebophrya sp. A25]